MVPTKAKEAQTDLSEINFKLGQIDGKLDALVQTQNKTIYALIALAGATVGLKLMGSPPLLVVLSFVNGFIFLFASIMAICRRKHLRGWPYVLGFGVAGIVGNIHKIAFPAVTDVRNLFFIAGNLGLLLFVWQLDSLGQKRKV